MELDAEDGVIHKALSQIEKELGWGDSKDWSTRDFEALSNRIMEKTHVQLSVITLKRVWGRIRYESKPTITTLDTLVQFVGFENWRSFKQREKLSNRKAEPEVITPAMGSREKKRHTRRKPVAILAIAGLILGSAVIFYFTSFDTAKPNVDPEKFLFSSKKVVDVGVPNTVIFDYDARAAKPSDSVFIQQSWDKRLSKLVARDQRQHSSIYYYPGFFQAKLRVNDQIVKQHNLFIKSNGWLPMVDVSPVPVYFKAEDISISDGSIRLSLDKILQSNIQLQPKTPWVGYYNVSDFGEIMSDDFVFETEVKNEYSDGAAACQHTEVHVLFEGAAMVIPLSIPGCVSELNFGDMSGKKLDLSPLGVDFNKWVNIKVDVQDSVVHLLINEKKAFDLKVNLRPVKFAGMVFRFQGTGSVNFIKISKHNGDVTFEETFDLKQ